MMIKPTGRLISRRGPYDEMCSWNTNATRATTASHRTSSVCEEYSSRVAYSLVTIAYRSTWTMRRIDRNLNEIFPVVTKVWLQVAVSLREVVRK